MSDGTFKFQPLAGAAGTAHPVIVGGTEEEMVQMATSFVPALTTYARLSTIAMPFGELRALHEMTGNEHPVIEPVELMWHSVMVFPL